MYNPLGEECYVDTGATETMLPDYAALLSYHKLSNHYKTLGDSTHLRIEGKGTANYSLNGKTIKTRNVLHIPSLRGPLYSLRSHYMFPG